ncbi:MAG: hypothetical protein S4CHLAM2_09170 [Chlamydiales bacterium]|nr:hypothetical protein [Chlamydiales bacterium]
MRLTCLGFPSSNPSLNEIATGLARSERQERDELISSFALAMITLVLITLAFTFFGVASLPADVMMGLGIFPFLTGTFLGTVACGIFLGSVASLAIASVRNCQKAAWTELRDNASA